MWRPSVCVLALVAAACTETGDAGSSRPHGKLPVDERNPILMTNDSNYDNWQGEYAVLLASAGGLNLDGIIVGTSPNATDINANIADWRALMANARSAGLKNVPDPINSIGAALVRPESGNIDETTPNRSEGALMILREAERLSQPWRPLVVLTGGRLTDVADAYVMKHEVADWIVVVSTVGSLSTSGAVMGPPNGEMDPWADVIVTSRLRYVQVSARYDQLMDIPTDRLDELPDNDFGRWIAKKQPGIWDLPAAADQVGVEAVGIPSFVTEVTHVTAGSLAAGATTGPDLTTDPNGPLWLVTQVDAVAAINRFWTLLRDPATFPP